MKIASLQFFTGLSNYIYWFLCIFGGVEEKSCFYEVIMSSAEGLSYDYVNSLEVIYIQTQ